MHRGPLTAAARSAAAEESKATARPCPRAPGGGVRYEHRGILGHLGGRRARPGGAGHGGPAHDLRRDERTGDPARQRPAGLGAAKGRSPGHDVGQLVAVRHQLLRLRPAGRDLRAAQLPRQGGRAGVHDQHGGGEGALPLRPLPGLGGGEPCQHPQRGARGRARRPARRPDRLRRSHRAGLRRLRLHGDRRRRPDDHHLHLRHHRAAQGGRGHLPGPHRLRDQHHGPGRPRRRAREDAAQRAAVPHRRRDRDDLGDLGRPQPGHPAAVHARGLDDRRRHARRHAQHGRAHDGQALDGPRGLPATSAAPASSCSPTGRRPCPTRSCAGPSTSSTAA